MVNAEVLVSNHVLIAKGDCDGYSDIQNDSGDDFANSGPNLALLRVKKTVNSEATPVFFAVNTFKLSHLFGLERPSVFTKHAPRFRSVVVELFSESYDKFWAGDAFNPILVLLWCDQIRALASMVNLRALELNVRSMWLKAFLGHAALQELILEFKLQLLASGPSSLRQKDGVRDCGVWFAVSVDDSYLDRLDYITKTSMKIMMDGTFSEEMHKIGEGWREELGVSLE